MTMDFDIVEINNPYEINTNKDAVVVFEGLFYGRVQNGVFKPLPVPLPFSKELNQIITVDKVKDSELEILHAKAHTLFEKYKIPAFCKLHYLIYKEYGRRSLPHLNTEKYCDRVVYLIKEDFDKYIENISNVSDKVLLDDFRIVIAWYSRILSGEKLYHDIDGNKKEITEDEVKKLGLAIAKEMIKRGFKFHPEEYTTEGAKKMWSYISEKLGLSMEDFDNVQDITVQFLKKLTNEELEELWKWLHQKWKEEFPDGKVTEDFLNANIMIQTERFNRGLIDYSYEDKDELDKQARYSWQEYGTPKTLDKEITLEDVLKEFNQIKAIVPNIAPIGYLTGRLVNEGKIPEDHDIDLVLSVPPTPAIITAIRTALPSWIGNKLHIFYDRNAGSIGYSIPIFSQAFVITDPKIQIKSFNPQFVPVYYSENLEIGKYVIGVKPKSGFGKNEFFDVDEMWTKWGSTHLPCYIEEKVDGRRFQAHIGADGKVIAFFTEDTHRDRKDKFPVIMSELESLRLKNTILDGELLVFETEGKNFKNAKSIRALCPLTPREDTAVLTGGNEVPKELQERTVYVIHDILMHDGENVALKPYSERRKLYSSLIKDEKHIDVVKSVYVNSMQEFYKAVEEMRRANGSEGVVCKSADFVYPIKYSGENRSPDMCKLKNLKEIDVIVLDVISKKDTSTGKELDQFVYECGVLIKKEDKDKYAEVKEYNGKYYLIVGKSYSTAEKCKVGDIITIMPIRVRQYEKDGKILYTWMFPYFKEKKEGKSEPDTVETLEKLAKVGTSALDEDGIKKITIKLKACEFAEDVNICPLKKKFLRPYLSKVEVEKEVLLYPIACPLSQIFRCRYIKPYYYDIVPYASYDVKELSDDEPIADLNKYPIDVRKVLLDKYMEMPKGERDFVIQSHILTSKYVKGEKKIPEEGSQHLDFRFDLGDYLNGWTIAGGSVDEMITPDTLLETKGSKGALAEEKAVQPKVWMFPDKKAVGKRINDLKPNDPVPEMFDVIVGEGEPRGKMFVVTRGKLIVGVQKPAFHEYFIKDGEFFKDWTRIVFRAIQVDKLDEKGNKTGRKTLIWRVLIPKDQTPYCISDRAMKKGYLPPDDNTTPFPVEWTKENFKEQYEKWLEWYKEHKNKKELSDVSYAYKVHYWRGAIHVRAMYQKQFYLFIDDGSKRPQMFEVSDDIKFTENIFMVDHGRVDRQYMNMEGETDPNSFFNPNKKLKGTIMTIAKGKADYEENINEQGLKEITIKFKSGMKGTLRMVQEEKNADFYYATYELSEKTKYYHFKLDGKYDRIVIIKDDGMYEIISDNIDNGECIIREIDSIDSGNTYKIGSKTFKQELIANGDTIIYNWDDNFKSFRFGDNKICAIRNESSKISKVSIQEMPRSR